MKKVILTATITGGKDLYGAWINEINEINGIYGAGATIEKSKESLSEGIKLYIENNETIPKELQGDYEINYIFDCSGLLKYYSKFISFAGMKELTGINQKQLWNYANGYATPKKATIEKILKGLNSFGKELSQVKVII